MERDSLLKDSEFSITTDELDKLVNGWKQREEGDEDLEYYRKKGGEDWLVHGLKTDTEHGIDPRSIHDREGFYGSNRKEVAEPKTFMYFVNECLKDFLLRVLIVAGIFSMIVDEIMEAEERATAWIEGFAILLAVFLITMVTALNNLKKDREFTKLNEEAESGKVVTIIRNGQKLIDQGINMVEVGDLVEIKSGMENPGDAIVVSGFSISMDESSMTGESDAMVKDSLKNCLVKKDKLRAKDPNKKFGLHDLPSPVVLAGTKVQSGFGTMLIIAVGPHSSIGKINEIIESGEDEMTPLQKKLEKIARDVGDFGFYAALVLIIAMTIRWIIDNSLNGGNGWNTTPVIDQINSVLQIILMGVAVLVMAIPEGLPLAVTLSLAYSVGQMMKEKNLVRKLEACETMGGANIICSDKTGTLTKNEMYLTHFWSGQEYTVYNPTLGTINNFSTFIQEKERNTFVTTVIANSLEDPTQKKGNPTEMAILKYIQSCGVDVVKQRESLKKVFQATFTSDRKRMSTIIDINGKQYAYIKGASEYISSTCDKLYNYKANKLEDKDEKVQKAIEGAIDGFARKALRTIAIAYKEVSFSQLNMTANEKGIYEYELGGFTLLGICGIKDVIRPEVPGSIQKCHKAGIDVKMVTGDNKTTAQAIAEEIGIITEKDRDKKIVMEGPEFLRLIGGVVCANCRNQNACDCVKNESERSKPGNEGKKIRVDTIKEGKEFDKIWRNLAVLARSRPEDKYALVTGLKERGNVVAVTGDGTNDAPALSKADVGFAMGIAGTEVAKQAADILLMDDNFASIVVAAKWGRNIYDSIRKFLTFQLTVNVVAVSMTFVSCVGLEEGVFSTVQILWINLIMDTFAALALATEPPSDELLDRKPNSKDDYIIAPLMKKHIFAQSIYQVVVMLIFIFAGPLFLRDRMWLRQVQPGTDLIVSGFKYYGYDRKTYAGDFSVHAAYNFNIFVMMQLGNFFNCRILDDSLNIFKHVTKSPLLIGIIGMILVLQGLFLTLCGPAIKVAQWGLDPYGWALCIVIAMGSWIWSFIFKFIPMEKILKGSGNEEISTEELNRSSTISLKKAHDQEFFQRRESMKIKQSFVRGKSTKKAIVD